MKKLKPVRKTHNSRQAADANEAAADSAVPSKTRARVGNVRGLILELLESGPKSSPTLVAHGGFSPASVFLNIKALKQEGLLTSAREGREVLFTLTGARTSEAEKRKSNKKSTKAPSNKSASHGIELAVVPSQLHAALNGLTVRLSRVEALPEKLLVLSRQQLSGADRRGIDRDRVRFTACLISRLTGTVLN